MKYSVVVPLYNEQESIIKLQEDLKEVMDSLDAEYEIIYVDDASTDSSLSILRGLEQEFSRVKVISFTKNCGQSGAFFAGFIKASGEWIITLDADGQNPPDQIKKLIPFTGEFDFITGIRQDRQDSAFRWMSSRTAYWARRIILGDVTTDVGCSLRIFKRVAVEKLPFFKNFHRFFTFLAKHYGFRVKEVRVKHLGRASGISKYSTLKRLREGLFDLWGVYWLKIRMIRYELKD